MQDDRIVELYWKRSEAAIRHTDQKYGHYLMKLSYNILADWEDSKESVNDTYLSAWKSMPPHRPSVLLTYLCKITRQISIDVFRKRNSAKRQASEYTCLYANWRTAFLPETQQNRMLTCTFWQRLFRIILQNYRGKQGMYLLEDISFRIPSVR